jgi:hypothetical protein
LKQLKAHGTVWKCLTLAGCNSCGIRSANHCCWNKRVDIIIVVYHDGRRNYSICL